MIILNCLLSILCLFFNVWSSNALLLSSCKLHKVGFRHTALRNTLRLHRNDDIEQELTKISDNCKKMEFLPIFQFLASNKYFVDHYWQKQPLLVNSKLQSLQQSLEMKDIEKITHSEFIDATKGIHSSSSGWKMHPVSKPRGNSYEDAKLRFEDIVSSMQDKNGTVVINSAGTIIPEMAKVCLEAIQAFKLPVAINIYMTNAGKEVSAPLHTDKQNVFVLQTQGQKHWRVFQPPHPAERCRADAFARGKGNDMFNFNELSEPLVDTVLSPGQMLYIPAGFPHTTDTAQVNNHITEPSLHLTLGVDSLIWGLTYADLRARSLEQVAIKDKLLATKLSPNIFFELHSALPLGFLSNGTDQNHSFMKESLVRLIQLAEPSKYTNANEVLSKHSRIEDVIEQTHIHYEKLLKLFFNMYQDVALQESPAIQNLSFFRSQPYLKEIEEVMEIYKRNQK